MKCPNDDTVLVMTDRSGIEIDYCPQCRGVWLDRGELDKIIDRSSGQQAAAAPAQVAPRPTEPHYEERYEHRPDHKPAYYDGHHPDGQHYRKHKKESFLGDLFDF